MKKLLLLLAFISTFAFGIEKKTPTGGSVKDKPGKSQQPGYIEVTQNIPTNVTPNASYPVELARIKLTEGTWDLTASTLLASDDSSAFSCGCYGLLSEFAGGGSIPGGVAKRGINYIITNIGPVYATMLPLIFPEQRVVVAPGQTKTFYLTLQVTTHTSGDWNTGSWVYLRAKAVR